MSTITRICKVGSDGNVLVPVGIEQAGEDVEVVVQPLRVPVTPDRMTPQQWREFVLRTAGSIDDPTFKRHEQGDYEQRESLE